MNQRATKSAIGLQGPTQDRDPTATQLVGTERVSGYHAISRLDATSSRGTVYGWITPMRACLLTMLLLSGCGNTENSKSLDGPGSDASTGGAGIGGSASSSSEVTSGGSTGGTGTGTGGSAATSAEYYVTADLDADTVSATTDVSAYWFPGLLEGRISVTGTADSRTWYFMILNAVSDEACAGGYITLDDLANEPGASELATFWEGGSCTVAVTQAAPNVGDVLEGTFEAVLANPQGSAVSVTNGHFRAPRAADDTGP